MEYRVNNISYKYTPDGKEVLKNVSFSIEKGKVTAIVGPSGCGKSTLVEIFSGVIPKLISNGVLEGSFDMPEKTFVSVGWRMRSPSAWKIWGFPRKRSRRGWNTYWTF